MEGSRQGKTTILLKGMTVTVDSEVPLLKGERVTVRVARLHPGVILRIIQGGIIEKAGLLDYLRLFRSNPEALSDLLVEGNRQFSPDTLGELAAHIGIDDAKRLYHMVRSLLFSGESLKNPLFLREYLHTLGYLMEHARGETLKGKTGRGQSPTDSSPNLKGILMKVADRLQPLLRTGDFPAAEKLAGFVRSSLQAIHSHQVINYLFQEHEDKYLFQIPLLFPENNGRAEIFVKFGDRDSPGDTRGGGKKILFLLNMDALGEIIAEAGISGNKINCVLKCADGDIGDFIKPFLQELGGGLAALGYEVESLQCVVSHRDTSEIRETVSREFQDLFTLDEIDLLA